MSKFKQTLKIIEEGLLKPMSDTDIEQVEADRVKERVDEILSRSTKNADGSIDVHGDVDLYRLNLKKIPLKFNKVSGYFDCSYNNLTSLEGAPKEVGGAFWCTNNQLTSLEGCPKEVGGDFICIDSSIIFTKDQVRAVCNVKGMIYV